MLSRCQQLTTEPVVVIHHEATVSFYGARTCALMQYGAHLAELATAEALEEVVLVHVIGNFAAGQVAEFVTVSQVIDGDDFGFVALVERLNEVATDKARGAGYDDRHARFPVRVRSPHCNQGEVRWR